METKYKINDIVYYVNDFRVVKCIINEVVIKTDKQGTHILYLLSPYKRDGKSKNINCLEAFLVDNLTTAKESALTNWKKITQQVENDLKNLTDEAFEPTENNENK